MGSVSRYVSRKPIRKGKATTIPVMHGARACPVRAVGAWLEAAGITEGPVFRRLYKSQKVSEKALKGYHPFLVTLSKQLEKTCAACRVRTLRARARQPSYGPNRAHHLEPTGT